MPIFRVKSVKIYTGKKNLHEHARGARDKYHVWLCVSQTMTKHLSRNNQTRGKKWILAIKAGALDPICVQIFYKTLYHGTGGSKLDGTKLQK